MPRWCAKPVESFASAAEVLEMIHESVTAEAAEVAQYWQVRMVTAAAASKATLKKEDIHDI